MKNKLLCASKQILLCCIKVLNAYARFCFVFYVAITYQFHAHMVFSGMRSLNTVESFKYSNIIKHILLIAFVLLKQFFENVLYSAIDNQQICQMLHIYIKSAGLNELAVLVLYFLYLRYDLGTNIKSKISVSCICINKNRMTFWIKATWV